MEDTTVSSRAIAYTSTRHQQRGARWDLPPAHVIRLVLFSLSGGRNWTLALLHAVGWLSNAPPALTAGRSGWL
jgi:hypothetical protein